MASAWFAGGDLVKNNQCGQPHGVGFHRCGYRKRPRHRCAASAAVGHSRNGKTALLAAAFDERITLAIPISAPVAAQRPAGQPGWHASHRFPAGSTLFKEFNDAGAFASDQNWQPFAPRPCFLERRKASGQSAPVNSKCCKPPTRCIASSVSKDWRSTNDLPAPARGKAGSVGYIREANI
jgi:hypothetical protein